MALEFEPTTYGGYTYKEGEAERRALADKFRKIADEYELLGEDKWRKQAAEHQRVADWYQEQADAEADAWWESRLIDPLEACYEPVVQRTADEELWHDQMDNCFHYGVEGEQPEQHHKIVPDKLWGDFSSLPDWLQMTLVGLSLAAPVVSIIIWVFTQS